VSARESAELRLPRLTAPSRNVARPKPVFPLVSCGLPLIARVKSYNPDTAPGWVLFR
jgi:hypothetical protein